MIRWSFIVFKGDTTKQLHFALCLGLYICEMSARSLHWLACHLQYRLPPSSDTHACEKQKVQLASYDSSYDAVSSRIEMFQIFPDTAKLCVLYLGVMVCFFLVARLKSVFATHHPEDSWMTRHSLHWIKITPHGRCFFVAILRGSTFQCARLIELNVSGFHMDESSFFCLKPGNFQTYRLICFPTNGLTHHETVRLKVKTLERIGAEFIWIYNII